MEDTDDRAGDPLAEVRTEVARLRAEVAQLRAMVVWLSEHAAASDEEKQQALDALALALAGRGSA